MYNFDVDVVLKVTLECNHIFDIDTGMLLMECIRGKIENEIVDFSVL